MRRGEEASAPASEVGLERGDIVVAIDGRPVTELTEDEVKERLPDGGRDVGLRVSRDDTEMDVSLRPRKLL